MTRCKHNKTGFGMCPDCIKWIKQTEEDMKDNMKPNPLNQYYEACYNLTEAFIVKYYTDKDYQLSDIDWWWIGDQVGGCLGVNDEFWSMDDIVTAMELKPTQKQLFDWYWYQIEEHTEGRSPITLTNYLKMKK